MVFIVGRSILLSAKKLLLTEINYTENESVKHLYKKKAWFKTPWRTLPKEFKAENATHKAASNLTSPLLILNQSDMKHCLRSQTITCRFVIL